MATVVDLLQGYWLVTLLITIVGYLGAGAIYRLYFSPVAKFPGPKLAALTLWYEFYHDVVRRGQYIFEVRKMHEKYGPIVRINPYEVSIDDIDFYDELFTYSRTAKRDRYEWQIKLFGTPRATFSAGPHELHRVRKAHFAPFFGKASVKNLEPKIVYQLERLCAKLDGYKESKEPVPLGTAFTALTTDIITEYVFGRTWNKLEAPGMGFSWHRLMSEFGEMSAFIKQFGWATDVMKAIPPGLAQQFFPDSVPARLQHELGQLQYDVVDCLAASDPDSKVTPADRNPEAVLIQLARSPDIPPEAKTFATMFDEAQNLVGAGTETTARALRVIVVHLLSNPAKMRRLKEELATVMPERTSVVSWARLEQLPYLTAVVMEGLRLSYGVAGRLTRIAPEEAMKFKQWTIPAGVPMSAWTVYNHQNETAFPDCQAFQPERWLVPKEERAILERHFTPFAKGLRMCIGSNLAFAEIYLTTATLFRRFDFALFKTDRSDVDLAHDFFVAVPKLDSKGVRVLVK
ncbi:MAG: hypothetical protein M1817_002075 [Caeruleum heppii]|nr:MAG: hypothetical protein M1817_002075 [Caeruleum heppii]